MLRKWRPKCTQVHKTGLLLGWVTVLITGLVMANIAIGHFAYGNFAHAETAPVRMLSNAS